MNQVFSNVRLEMNICRIKFKNYESTRLQEKHYFEIIFFKKTFKDIFKDKLKMNAAKSACL